MNYKLNDKYEKEFLENVLDIISYWKNSRENKSDSIDGAVHSILTLIDGENGNSNGYMLLPLDDDGMPIQIDISGNLNDKMFNIRKL